MKYLSVCSGIEAATVAWHSLGWEAAGFSEIEKFPAEVLKHHYPTVTNFGDMTKYKEWNLGTIELLVGGTPCQSFSVAGLRKGLEDPRGNLMLTYCGLLDRFKPKWFVWENVPGVLSSGGGRDFGSFLGAVAELGYGWAYRVLDAQYFGVAQRRRRVFVVGCLGDWKSAAKVLFEPESLCRNNPPSREKRKETTATSGVGVEITSPITAREYKGPGTDGMNEISATIIPVSKVYIESSFGGYREDFVAGTMKASGGVAAGGSETFAVVGTLDTDCGSSKLSHQSCVSGHILPIDTQNKLVKVYENHPSDSRVKEMGDVCSTVTSNWGTGGGNTPFVQEVYSLQGAGTTSQNANGSGINQDIAFTLNSTDQHAVAYSFDSLASNSMKSKNPNSGCREVDLSKTLDTTVPDPSKNQGGLGIIQAVDTYNQKISNVSQTLRAGSNVDQTGAVIQAFNSNARPDEMNTSDINQGLTRSQNAAILKIDQPPIGWDAELNAKEQVMGTLLRGGEGGRTDGVMQSNMAVRRLTPVECERLQGFPDHYTDIKPKGKDTPDGPRYKALGNSMAVPVMKWIGKRIQMVEDES